MIGKLVIGLWAETAGCVFTDATDSLDSERCRLLTCFPSILGTGSDPGLRTMPRKGMPAEEIPRDCSEYLLAGRAPYTICPGAEYGGGGRTGTP